MIFNLKRLLQGPRQSSRLHMNSTDVIKLQQNTGLAMQRRARILHGAGSQRRETSDSQFYFSPECWRKWPSLAGRAQEPWTGTSLWGSGWGNSRLQVHREKEEETGREFTSRFLFRSQGNVGTSSVSLDTLTVLDNNIIRLILTTIHSTISIHWDSFFPVTLIFPIESLLRPNESA